MAHRYFIVPKQDQEEEDEEYRRGTFISFMQKATSLFSNLLAHAPRLTTTGP
jgi:hypothetical protein